jgi:hypothetical protein
MTSTVAHSYTTVAVFLISGHRSRLSSVFLKGYRWYCIVVIALMSLLLLLTAEHLCVAYSDMTVWHAIIAPQAACRNSDPVHADVHTVSNSDIAIAEHCHCC